jgi:serine/threonine protein kinase
MSSASYAAANSNSNHVRRTASANELREGSEPVVHTGPKPNVTQRSNSVPMGNTADEESVMIEEKRPKFNGEGYTIHRYIRGRLLGKGGFAKVYLCTAMDTNKAYAIKIVPKANLTKARARQKVMIKFSLFSSSVFRTSI